MRELDGVALVTGAARRIGAAIARELHAAGMNVAIHYRASGAEARALAAELNQARPDSAHCLKANLLSVAQLRKLAEQAQERWGRLDALVNNASSYYRTPLAELSEDDFDDLIGSNLKAPLFLTQACAARMKRGAVVNIADVYAQRPRKGFAAYCAAKAGLMSLTESLARELAPDIRVNAVAPGHILWSPHTVMSDAQRQAEIARVPLARMGDPGEIARAVRFLLSPTSAYITGVVLPVDGGLRLV